MQSSPCMDQFATYSTVFLTKICKIILILDNTTIIHRYLLTPYIAIAQFGFKCAHSASLLLSDLLQIGISLNRNGLGYAYR